VLGLENLRRFRVPNTSGCSVSGQMAFGRRVSRYHGHTGCQARHINAGGSRHSDSIQLYSLSASIYLMYIYICYYHTSRTRRKHPVSHPSPRSSFSDEDVGGEEDSEYDAEDAVSMMASKMRRTWRV
jgi:hypothetical protein